MSTTPPAHTPGTRHLAPIRWPKPNAHGVGLFVVWLVGVGIGVGLPAVVVPPAAVDPSTTRVLEAFAITVVGVLIMMAAALALYRRYREGGLLVFAFVPAAAVLAGGFILMGLKLFGS